MATNKLTYNKFPDNEELNKEFHPSLRQEYATVEGCTLTLDFVKYADDILDFEVNDDDVYVVSFPKSGTTWTQEMVWCIGNDLDFEKAKRSVIHERFPFIELFSVISAVKFPKPTDTNAPPILPIFLSDSLKYTKNLQGRRFIKTHLPLHLVPRQLQTAQRKAKVVYVARDPRDVCISYFHHYRLLHGFTGDLTTFLTLFLNDKVLWAPYWKHILNYWNIRNQPNVLFIKYENMKRDLPSVIERVAAFLEKSLTAEQVSSLTHHLSFENMKNNPSVNYDELSQVIKHISGSEGFFMRSGQSGVFLKDFTEEQINMINIWCKKNLEGTDYDLPEYSSKPRANN